MISRQEFKHGISLVLSSFNRRVPDAVIDTWFSELAPRYDSRSWANACRATITEEDVFPSNFIRAMLSRAPRTQSTEIIIPINPDTNRPYTPKDAHDGERRYAILRSIMGDKDDPRRRRILKLAEDPGSGAEIQNELDIALARGGHLEPAPF